MIADLVTRSRCALRIENVKVNRRVQQSDEHRPRDSNED